MTKYLSREKDRDIQRKEKYLNLKVKYLGEQDLSKDDMDKIVGASGSMNY